MARGRLRAAVGAADLRGRLAPLALASTLALGDASYSLYLIHPTAISFFVVLATKIGWLTVLSSASAQLGVYVATLTGAVLFHRAIEAPLLVACRRRWVERGAEPERRLLVQAPVGLARQ